MAGGAHCPRRAYLALLVPTLGSMVVVGVLCGCSGPGEGEHSSDRLVGGEALEGGVAGCLMGSLGSIEVRGGASQGLRRP